MKTYSVTFPEGSDVGYRWYAAKGLTPLYAFGHGLSYTDFRYDGLQVTGGKTLTVRFTVTNTGKRAGADVPQVYVSRPGKAKRLIGWGKPQLAPGETRQVTVKADPRVLADFDVAKQRWIVPAGSYAIEVGPSAAKTTLRGSARLTKQSIKP
jgi:beta-glucosidase